MPLVFKIAVPALLTLILIVLFISGCSARTKYYKVDYCGSKAFYTGAKDSYKAGTTVELIFDMIATDTNYYFYLDGSTDGLSVEGSEEGFVLRFTMPEHDVKLEYTERNSMEYIPENTDAESDIDDLGD